MKVLLVDVNCKYSSTGKIVYDIYTNLKDDGYEAVVAYGRGLIINEDNIYRFSPKWEVFTHALLTRITGYNGCFSPIATHRLINIIEKLNPDVIHLNDIHGYFVNIIPLMNYLKKKNIFTVWTFHCEFMYTGKCGHSYECEKWKTQCSACPQLKAYPKSLFFDNTKRMFSQKKKAFQEYNNIVIVTPSKWLADRVNQSFLKDKKINVVHNGIDTDIFYPRQNGHKKKSKTVIVVASHLMSSDKGGNYVLEIANRLLDKDIQFVLIGNDESDNVFPANVEALGVIQNQEILAGYYSEADCFLICSKRETFSMTTVEALCCGTPVVGFKAGAPETIALDKYSIFVEYGDVNAVIQGIEEMLFERTLNREQIASDAKEKYSKQVMYSNYLKIYRKG